MEDDLRALASAAGLRLDGLRRLCLQSEDVMESDSYRICERVCERDLVGGCRWDFHADLQYICIYSNASTYGSLWSHQRRDFGQELIWRDKVKKWEKDVDVSQSRGWRRPIGFEPAVCLLRDSARIPDDGVT